MLPIGRFPTLSPSYLHTGSKTANGTEQSYHICNSLPLDETLAMINMDKPNEDQLQLMAAGMEIFVGVLGNVVAGIRQERH